MRVLAHSLPSVTPTCTTSRRVSCVCMALMVVTDIDDTIKSSGGVALAGIPLGGVDVSYERGSFYPGVFDVRHTAEPMF